MKAKVWDNVKFSGRLSMFKNWGDSTGSQVFDSWNRYTMDATNSANTTSDYVLVDRAYFDWSNMRRQVSSPSVAVRPPTAATDYRENELRGGTVPGNLMSLNFDGSPSATTSRTDRHRGVVARFCYGQGFESEWGNGEMFNEIVVEDTHFAGFNFRPLQ